MLATMKASFLLPLFGIVTFAMASEESVVKPEIESVGLFKNGIAVVRASFPIAGPGTYRWDHIPQVIHGTFWVESDGEVSVLSTTRRVEETDESGAPTGLLQQDLAGKQVTVTLRQADSTFPPLSTAITGTVWSVPPRPGVRQWDTNYASLNPSAGSYGWWNGSRQMVAQPSAAPGNFLILDDGTGNRRYVDMGSIAALEAKGPFGPMKRLVEKPVLVFDVRKAPAKGGAVRVTWLTKGLAWMPSYRVDLGEDKNLRIRQNAVVRNESNDLAGTEIQLISGFPSVQFGSVDSPLWQGTTLASFFQQINQSAEGAVNRNVLSQQMVYSNSVSSTPVPMPELKEQGEASNDIHYESIGKHSLKSGDSLAVDIASATAAYERVVEWVVPDGRDERGRYSRRTDSLPDEMAWDAVRFKNPFKFPMTTAAAVITGNGKFLGQNQTEWVNPGQQACLRITRALSVQTESSEIEEEGKREIVYIAGDDYRRTVVKGRLIARNYRGQEITMTIRREFSGILVEADANPESKLRAQGVFSVNPRRQLDWTIKIPAGGEKEITYRYEVLVDQ
jgi:hypothetical protein